jgi:hypothetical protein
MSAPIRRLAALVAVALTTLVLAAPAAVAVPECDVPEPPPICTGDPKPKPKPKPGPPATTARLLDVQLSGPAFILWTQPHPPGAISSRSPERNYTALISIERTSGTGPVTMGPFWLWERDGSLYAGNFLSFVPTVTFAPGATTAVVTMKLACDFNGGDYPTVTGTATTTPAGAPNDPNSYEGSVGFLGFGEDPAEVSVSLGPVGTKNPVSNELSIRCDPNPWS